MNEATRPPNAVLRQKFESGLSLCDKVHLLISQHPDLVVPAHVQPSAQQPLHLEYGLNFPIPIPDIKADDSGVSATLSFDRSPYKTFVPWDAVVGMVYGTIHPSAPPKRPKLSIVK